MASNNESFQKRQSTEMKVTAGGIGAGLLFGALALPGMAGFAYTIGAAGGLTYIGDRWYNSRKNK